MVGGNPCSVLKFTRNSNTRSCLLDRFSMTCPPHRIEHMFYVVCYRTNVLLVKEKLTERYVHHEDTEDTEGDYFFLIGRSRILPIPLILSGTLIPAKGGTDGFRLSPSPDKRKNAFLCELRAWSEAGDEYPMPHCVKPSHYLLCLACQAVHFLTDSYPH